MTQSSIRQVNVTGMMNASAAHIHMAKEGENGEVVADLLNTSYKQGQRYCIWNDIQR